MAVWAPNYERTEPLTKLTEAPHFKFVEKKLSPPSKRWWFITLNNPSSDWKADFQALGSQWGIGQLEQGENGTPHVQGVVWFAEKLKNTYWKGKSCWSPLFPLKTLKEQLPTVPRGNASGRSVSIWKGPTKIQRSQAANC